MAQQQRRQYDPNNKKSFTPEERAIMKECQNESLYYSCLPLTFVMGAGTHYLRHLGIIKGSFAATAVAVATGFVAGKIAYLPTCRKKFTDRLPNSPYTQLLNGEISTQEYINIKEQEYQGQVANSYQQPYKNQQQDFHNNDGFNDDHVENEDVKQNVTYDELRRKHRGQYGVNQPVTPRPRFDNQPTEVDWNKPRMLDTVTPKDKGKKNQYGDILDDGK